MEPSKMTTEDELVTEKVESLIAIGAATAANCIPCFNHLYEKGVNAGLSIYEIRWAVEIAEQVRGGAQIALKNAVNETVGKPKRPKQPCSNAEKTCC